MQETFLNIITSPDFIMLSLAASLVGVCALLHKFRDNDTVNFLVGLFIWW